MVNRDETNPPEEDTHDKSNIRRLDVIGSFADKGRDVSDEHWRIIHV